MEVIDNDEWRARMLEQHGLDDSAIDAWFRSGYTPTGIELFYANLKLGIVPSYKSESISAKPFVFEIGGRHFSRKDDNMLMNVGSTLTVEIGNAMADDKVGIVELLVNLDGKSFVVRGSTQRHPDDEPDGEVAITLAALRALQSLCRRLERQVSGRISHNDWVATQRPLVAEARRQRAEAKEATPRNDWELLCEAIREAGFELVPMEHVA